IRDDLVTGVQTCALPISVDQEGRPHLRRKDDLLLVLGGKDARPLRRVVSEDRRVEPREKARRSRCFGGWPRCAPQVKELAAFLRSEERRVGKQGTQESVW